MAEQGVTPFGNANNELRIGESMKGVSANAAVFSGGTEDKIPETTESTKFDLPVDSENKAKTIKLFSLAKPHMRAFHLSWFSFFISFISTFAAAPMIPVLRDDIDLTIVDLGNAGVAAVSGTILARIVMGYVCDAFGPRYGHGVLMLGTAPAVFAMAVVGDAAGFIVSRMVIGFSLATFVATQYWTSVMFNPKIVGLANATTAGWGNLGGGITQFLMPVVYAGMLTHGSPFLAWRLSFFVPGCCHILVGVLCLLFAQDLPDGQFQDLTKRGDLQTTPAAQLFAMGMSNYRMWAMTISYAFCFGIELTMNNIVTAYFFDQFDLPLATAGVIGSLYGMMNLFARSLGGVASDWAANKYGMRGRLWSLWILQTAEGFICVVMGRAYESLPLTIFFMVVFSLFVQMSEGASFGIVPFLSKRTLGVCSGFIGAGGNAGGAIMMAAFFKSDKYETYDGISLMGVCIIACTLVVVTIHFPQWGSMLFPPNEHVTEQDYYLAEYSEEEKVSGVANAAIKFAEESKGERGQARLALMEKETPNVQL